MTSIFGVTFVINFLPSCQIMPFAPIYPIPRYSLGKIKRIGISGWLTLHLGRLSNGTVHCKPFSIFSLCIPLALSINGLFYSAKLNLSFKCRLLQATASYTELNTSLIQATKTIFALLDQIQGWCHGIFSYISF